MADEWKVYRNASNRSVPRTVSSFRNLRSYIVQLANGLTAAHAAGIIRRDVTQSSAILTTDRQVKLLGLGLALLPPREPEQLASIVINSDDEPVTQTGRAKGTKAYMAPEQMNDSHNAGVRADVYGLGATLFFLLKGTPPSEDAYFPPGIAVSV